MVDVWHAMIGSNRNPFTKTEGQKRGECRGREKVRKRKGEGEGSGLDITMIAGDEKKGAGARRAVCGVQTPRVFRTAIDALRVVLSEQLG